MRAVISSVAQPPIGVAGKLLEDHALGGVRVTAPLIDHVLQLGNQGRHTRGLGQRGVGGGLAVNQVVDAEDLLAETRNVANRSPGHSGLCTSSKLPPLYTLKT